MIDDVLGEIRETEAKAEGIRKQAQQQARAIISQARTQAELESKEKYRQARTAARKMVEQAEDEAARSVKEDTSSLSAGAAIREKASAGTEKAVEFIIERITTVYGDR